MRDSNPHSLELVPKTSVSTNSTNWAMVPAHGFEPRTYRLQGDCTTTVLCRHFGNFFRYHYFAFYTYLSDYDS